MAAVDHGASAGRRRTGGRRRRARSRVSSASACASGSRGGPRSSIGPGAQGRAWPSTTCGETTPFHSSRSSRTVASIGRSVGLRSATGAEGDHARAGPAAPDAHAQVTPVGDGAGVGERRGRDQEAHGRVARAERPDPLELLGELDPELVGPDERVDALDRAQVVRAGAHPRPRRGLERRAEHVQALARDLHPGGRAMPAVALELVAGRREAREHVVGGDRPRRAGPGGGTGGERDETAGRW